MSFVSYENFKEKALSGPGVMLHSIFEVGNIVDSKIVEEFRDDVPPAHNSSSIMQMGEAYIYAKDEEGENRPCYVTFSRDNKDWVFCGACFENSVINRCEQFEYSSLTVGQYCVDKFDSEYIRAAEKLYADAKNGVDITGLSVIDDYMDFTAYSLAGYYFDTYSEGALEAFCDNGQKYQNEDLYEPVISLLKQREQIFNKDEWEEKFQNNSVRDVSELIADASARAGGSGDKNLDKTDVEIDR